MSLGSGTERERQNTKRKIQAAGSASGNSENRISKSSADSRDGGVFTRVEIGVENMTVSATTPPASSNVVTDKASERHASVTSTSSKKVRRAFSMPRNPFRWSRKFKTHNKDAMGNDEIDTAPDSCNGEYVTEKHIQLSSEEQLMNSNNNERDSMHSTGDADSMPIGGWSNKKYNQPHRSESIVSAASRVLRRSSFRKFLSRIAQHVTSVSIGPNKHSPTSNVPDRVPPIGGYQWPPDQTPGVTGLKNHGNTCFMNAVLQCLSHTDILAEYFVLDQYKADLKRRNKLNSRKFGTKGELTEQLANVLKALWTCKNESDHSTSFKAVVDRYGSQFRSSTQHDAQEFLFWLLDKVHEDLNTATKKRYKTIKNCYGRPDEVIAAETLANHIRCNNSFVQAVFQAQFRSSLTCPRCHKQSNTFDPFHCVSVQLPQLSQQIIFVNVVYVTQQPRQVKLGLTVPSGSPIVALREQLNADTGIAVNSMVLAEINNGGFSRVFCDSQPISMLEGIESVYCIEVPETNEETSDLMLLIANVQRNVEDNSVDRFGTPFCIQVNRDCSYVELQKKLLKEMSSVLKPEVFAYTTPVSEMFRIRVQDPSADPDTYLEQVEHPLFMEIIDMALSVLSSDAGPPHVKLLLEWTDSALYFSDTDDPIVEHESVAQLKKTSASTVPLSLEQCLEHYTKEETLSAENAWRCPNCQQYLPVVKTLGLWSLPDILVIHFKRFRQQHEKGADAAKLTTMVKFPMHGFDMSPHLARGASSSNDSLNRDESRSQGSPWRKMTRDYLRNGRDREMKDNRYDLYAVCYHQGETLETGHYTAACKNPYDHQWYKFDDQRVSQVPADQVEEQIINNEAYILFYQRRKFDNSECSGSSSTSGDHWVSRIAPSALPVITTLTNATNTTNSLDCSNSTVSAINEKLIEDREKETISPIEPTSDVPHKSISNRITDTVVIEKTSETELVDIEKIEYADESVKDELKDPPKEEMSEVLVTSGEEKAEVEVTVHVEDKIEKSIPSTNENLIQQSNVRKTIATKLPEYTPQPLWPTSSYTSVNESVAHARRSEFNGIHHQPHHCYHSDADGSSNCANLRHSFSTTSNYKLKECDAISSMLRNSATASSCSKDTLLYIDQQSHSLIDEDDSYLGGRSLWISPVTPHKLITVSPKN